MLRSPPPTSPGRPPVVNVTIAYVILGLIGGGGFAFAIVTVFLLWYRIRRLNARIKAFIDDPCAGDFVGSNLQSITSPSNRRGADASAIQEVSLRVLCAGFSKFNLILCLPCAHKIPTIFSSVYDVEIAARSPTIDVVKPWQRALDLFALGDALLGGNDKRESILKLIRAVYVSDFGGNDTQQIRSLLVELMMRLEDLPWDLRRVVLDLTWSHTDDSYKLQLYDARFARRILLLTLTADSFFQLCLILSACCCFSFCSMPSEWQA